MNIPILFLIIFAIIGAAAYSKKKKQKDEKTLCGINQTLGCTPSDLIAI